MRANSGKKLIGDLAGYWSVRLTYRDRFVYRIDEESQTVFILRARTHYHGIWISISAFTTRGPCADLFRVVLTHHELIVGEVVLMETERVLRDKLRAPDDLVAMTLDLLRQQVLIERPEGPHAAVTADPDDAWVLASALAGDADVLVTGDHDLLDLEEPAAIRILSPRELWTVLREGEKP